MSGQRNKSALLILLTIASIISANIILNSNYLTAKIAEAEIRTGEETTVNFSTGDDLATPAIASTPAGDFVAVWSSEGKNGGESGIYLQRFNRLGQPMENEDIRVNDTATGQQSNPAIAMDSNGNFVIAWQKTNTGHDTDGIYIKAYNSNGQPITSETRLNATNQNDAVPKIAIDYDNAPENGFFVITWENHDTTSNTYNVYAQRFKINFNAPSSAFNQVGNQINIKDDPALLSAQSPTVAMNTHGDFIIAWSGTSADWPTNSQAWFQAYNANGQKIGPFTKINSSAVIELAASKLAISVDKKSRASAGGNFVVAYSGRTAEFPNGGIFARQIQCSGTDCTLNPVELKVFTNNRGIQEENPALDSDYLGNFTIAWQGYTSATDYDIYAQSFKWNDGHPLHQITRFGTEFRVNSITDGPQQTPCLTMTADGQYTIIWANGASPRNIKFQMFVSDLFKDQGETLANPVSQTNQYNADTAVAPDGRHAVVWVNLSAPRGIFFTLWDENNNIIAQNVRVDSDDPANIDDKPSIAFFQDTNGSGQGRFIIAWEGVAPPCAGPANGTDILYREITASGNPLRACESIANLLNLAGNQGHPDISAGYYNNNGGEPENNFAISYLDMGHIDSDEPYKVIAAFHAKDDFAYNILEPACDRSNCKKTSVAINPENNKIIYAWENADDHNSGIFIRQAVGNILKGSSNLQVNDPGITMEDYPDAAFLPNDQFIIAFRKESDNTSSIYAKRYLFNETSNPSIIGEQFQCCQMSTQIQQKQYYPRIASNRSTGDFIVVWSNEIGSNQIYGQLYKYISPDTGGLTTFGTPFKISSTRDGATTLPAVGMNNYGKISVSWEGNFEQNTTRDQNGIAIQRLTDPLFTPPISALHPFAEQVITGGGRTLLIPSSISYPTSNVNTTNTSTIQTSIRNDTCGGSDLKYIEVTDLDGAPFTITATIPNDFYLTPPGNTSYIPKSGAFIRNWDQNIADTDPDCSIKSPLSCVLTLNSSMSKTSFQLATESEGFVSLENQQALATKTSNSEIGKWRFYPEFKLEIPARTPPGNHTSEIIFSLT